MPFVIVRVGANFDKSKVEAACKLVWVEMSGRGPDIMELLKKEDVGGLIVDLPETEKAMAVVDFYYVDRGEVFDRELRNKLRDAVYHLGDPEKNLACSAFTNPVASENWFANPVWSKA